MPGLPNIQPVPNIPTLANVPNCSPQHSPIVPNGDAMSHHSPGGVARLLAKERRMQLGEAAPPLQIFGEMVP